MMIVTRASRAYPEGIVVVQSIGYPADCDVCDNDCFAFSVACSRDCAVLLVSGDVG